jgi:hypothetical protein
MPERVPLTGEGIFRTAISAATDAVRSHADEHGHKQRLNLRLRKERAMTQLALRSPAIARAHPDAIRYTLGGLLAFGALNAFAGGYYGMSGAEDVPREWLEGSPFDDYFIPGLVLFVVVGGSLLAAAIFVFAGLHPARLVAIAAGVVVLGWLVVETLIIGYVSWMQPATTIGALLILLLAWLQPGADMGRSPYQRRTSATDGR